MKRTILILAGLVGSMPTTTAQASRSLVEVSTKRCLINTTPILYHGRHAINNYSPKAVHDNILRVRPLSKQQNTLSSPRYDLQSYIFKKSSGSERKGNDCDFSFLYGSVAAFAAFSVFNSYTMADEGDQCEKTTFVMPSEENLYRSLLESGFDAFFLDKSNICKKLSNKSLVESELHFEIKCAVEDYLNYFNSFDGSFATNSEIQANQMLGPRLYYALKIFRGGNVYRLPKGFDIAKLLNEWEFEEFIYRTTLVNTLAGKRLTKYELERIIDNAAFECGFCSSRVKFKAGQQLLLDKLITASRNEGELKKRV